MIVDVEGGGAAMLTVGRDVGAEGRATDCEVNWWWFRQCFELSHICIVRGKCLRCDDDLGDISGLRA